MDQSYNKITPIEFTSQMFVEYEGQLYHISKVLSGASLVDDTFECYDYAEEIFVELPRKGLIPFWIQLRDRVRLPSGEVAVLYDIEMQNDDDDWGNLVAVFSVGESIGGLKYLLSDVPQLEFLD